MSHSTINKLSTSRCLDGLRADDIKAILRAAKEQRFSANSVVVTQAHRAEHLFLLTHGHARHFVISEDGQKILLRWLVPEEITGVATLLSKPSLYLMGTEGEGQPVLGVESHYPTTPDNSLSQVAAERVVHRGGLSRLVSHRAFCSNLR